MICMVYNGLLSFWPWRVVVLLFDLFCFCFNATFIDRWVFFPLDRGGLFIIYRIMVCLSVFYISGAAGEG